MARSALHWLSSRFRRSVSTPPGEALASMSEPEVEPAPVMEGQAADERVEQRLQVRGTFQRVALEEIAAELLSRIGQRLTQAFPAIELDYLVPLHADKDSSLFFGTIVARATQSESQSLAVAFCEEIAASALDVQVFLTDGNVYSTAGIAPGSESAVPVHFSERHFPSLGALLAYMRERYGLEVDAGTRHDRGKLEEYEAKPRYLFRGESELHYDTLSSMWRVMSELPPDLADPIVQRMDELLAIWRSEYGVGLHEAWAFMQHYGLPSFGVDFTRNLTVATAFAQFGVEQGMGAMAVIDLAAADAHLTWATECLMQDITNNFEAWRTMRQEAVWVSLDNGRGDLKDPILKPAITWYTFDHYPIRYTEADYVDYLYYDLMDQFSLRLGVSMSTLPKLPDPAAQWFAARLGSGLNIGHLLAEGFFGKGVQMNDPHWRDPRVKERVRQAKEHNRRRWSQDFP